jgi:hypothetical protein
MYIKDIELNNFRIYKGLNKISLLPSEVKNIVVVSGKNGFGKTTFLMSLVWCLYGKQMEKVDDLYEKEIKDKGNYTKYIAGSLNRKAQDEGETEFHVAITFSGVKIPDITCNEVKIKRTYNTVSSASDSVEVLIDGYPNELIEDLTKDNQRGEEIFIRDFILPIEIAKFFFFDAEKIVSLAEVNSSSQRRQLSKAYSEVLGIQKYEDLKANLEEKQDDYRRKSASPDSSVERTYYFRWWVYRKHIKETPGGFVITEFLPDVPWSGKYNTISCPAGHQFYEGRWLRDDKYLKDYARFWFHGGGSPRLYSFWAADAMFQMYKVTADTGWITGLLTDLVENYLAWEESNMDSSGLFWQIDDRDGMEMSIGGSGYRATINSYMYGDAMAISQIAHLAKDEFLQQKFLLKAENIKQLVQNRLWDDKDGFFKVLPREEGAGLVGVRELHGYVPWYFNLPDKDLKFASAWKQLMDSAGFFAPYGPTTAEQRCEDFMFKHKHECLWNGPSWPFATTQTLVALANLLNRDEQSFVSGEDYYQLLKIYTKCHKRTLENGTVVPWIDENIDPFTGEWLARSLLQQTERADRDRGKDYNHSGYNDLIISGLIGLRPRTDENVEVNPLLPKGIWDYFLLDKIPYHGHELTILYDKTGDHYHKGKGFMIFSNHQLIAKADDLQKLAGKLINTEK